MTLLSLANVSGGYGRNDVLRDVSLEVRAGEIVTIVGVNGAGKSTLLSAIVGLLPHVRGAIVFAGKPIHGLATERIVRRGLCLVPERRQLFGTMSVEENLVLGGFVESSRSAIRSRITEQFASFPILHERRRQIAQTLSGGQQQMLAIARGLMSAPRLLLLDEPSLGLAPLIVQQVFNDIQRIRSAGGTVLLVEQNAAAALRIADRAYVMKGGRIVDERTPRELAEDPAFSEAYLGGAEADSMESRIRARALLMAQSGSQTTNP